MAAKYPYIYKEDMKPGFVYIIWHNAVRKVAVFRESTQERIHESGVGCFMVEVYTFDIITKSGLKRLHAKPVNILQVQDKMMKYEEVQGGGARWVKSN